LNIEPKAFWGKVVGRCDELAHEALGYFFNTFLIFSIDSELSVKADNLYGR